MRLCISQLAICEISELDRYVGDYLISAVWDSEIEAFPVVPVSVASDSDIANGILTFAEYLGEKAVINVLSPARFYHSQVTGILGHVTDSAVLELLSRQRSRLTSKLSRKAA